MTEPYLEIGGFAEWLPLDLEQPLDVTGAIADQFADSGEPPALVAAVAGRLAVLAAQLRDLGSEERLMLRAWALLPPGGKVLAPRAVATLSAVPIAPGTDDGGFVDELVFGTQLYQPVDVEQIATDAGPAQCLRVRSYDGAGDELRLDETVSVFWLRPGDGVALLLTTLPIDDLVLAADVRDALVELATSFRGY